MGFGLLLIGYAITQMFYFLGTYEFIGMLLGYFIMFCGLCELRRYCPTFLYALVTSVLLILCSFYETFAGLDNLLGLGMIEQGSVIITIFSVVEMILMLVFSLTILYGIADMARRVDFPEIKAKAYRNMVFVGMFNLLDEKLQVAPSSST